MLRSIRSAIASVAGRAAADERGAIAIISAVMMPIFIAVLAISVDVTYWRYRQSLLQNIADSAAIEGLYSKRSGNIGAQVARDAIWSAERNGWDAGRGSATVNSPAASGSQSSNANSVEVVITSTEFRFFSSAFLTSAFTLSARGVASYRAMAANSGSGCILALNKSVPTAVSISNNAVIVDSGCDVISDSLASNSILLSNNTSVAGALFAGGGIVLYNGATAGVQHPNAAYTPDPYLGILKIPFSSAGPCSDSGPTPLLGTTNITPGHYCSGLTASNNVTVNMAPGIYYVDSDFSFGNGTALNAGGGVTIVLGQGFVPAFGNNARVVIASPSSGPTAGVALTTYTDNVSPRVTTLANNAGIAYSGVIYLPHETFVVSNNGNLSSIAGNLGCGHIVADVVSLSNNVTIGNNCKGIGVQAFGSSPSSWASRSGITIAD